MIWFFLMGMIAGAVGAVMVAEWWIKRHVRRVSAMELLEAAVEEAEAMKTAEAGIKEEKEE